MKKIFSVLIINLFLITIFFFSYLPSYALDCTDVKAGGNLDITTSCTFSGNINGVDNGTDTQNNALLSIASSGTLTVGATQQIAMGSLSIQTGGSIVIFDGGSLNFGQSIWMVDADSDGYPSSTTQIISSIAPLNARRRNVMATTAISDTNDSLSCPDNTNPAGNCNLCSMGNIVNQFDGHDLFGECPQSFYSCNGAGNCGLHAKRVFISSQIYNGNLGGLVGADNKCQTLADSANLGGSWKAWVSDSTTSVSSRMNQSGLPYILVDGTSKIADNWFSLVDGSLDNPILLSETNQVLGLNLRVWTNTAPSGNIYSSAANSTCTDWTSAVPSRNSRSGINSSNTSGEWTNSQNRSCNDHEHLYCFEQ